MIIDRKSGPSETELQKSRNESVILLLLVVIAFDFSDGVLSLSIPVSYCWKKGVKKGKLIIPGGKMTLIAPRIKLFVKSTSEEFRGFF